MELRLYRFRQVCRSDDVVGDWQTNQLFSLVGWNTSIGYTDASGEARTLKLTVGSDEYRTVWNEFLDSFERHLKTKGWFEKTVLYMDEIREDEMRQVVSFIKQHNPDWK